MNRDIKFRGNNLETNELFFGHLFYFDDGRYFISPKGVDVEGDDGEHPSEYILRGVKCIEVKSETVGQFTGLKDKNGVEIYEGDIVKFECVNESLNGTYEVVKGNSGEWRIDNRVQGRVLYYSLGNVEIIGNIYENPELLESRDV